MIHHKLIIIFLTIFIVGSFSQTNLLNTSIHECISCICHVVTGCYDLKKCANNSIDFDYWISAGSPRLNPNEDNQSSYVKCVDDDNCILNTIYDYVYTNNPGAKMCTYRDEDCRDFSILHINKRNCRRFGNRGEIRFDNCASKRSIPTFTRDFISRNK
nr:uncharacterized protein LOC111426626 [Onthophagus taurus]